MPAIIAKLPEGIFDAAARGRIARGIHAAAKAVEAWGDDPRQEFLAWVLIEEIPSGCLFAGGEDPLARVIPVVVMVYPPAGVIDDTGRAELVRLVHAAITSATPSADPRPVATSVIIREVADGTWGANGQLWHLADFARAAGYRHLQHLVGAAKPA